LARETHWPENQTAPVANRVDEGATLFEKPVALLNTQAHPASCEEPFSSKLQGTAPCFPFDQACVLERPHLFPHGALSHQRHWVKAMVNDTVNRMFFEPFTLFP